MKRLIDSRVFENFDDEEDIRACNSLFSKI